MAVGGKPGVTKLCAIWRLAESRGGDGLSWNVTMSTKKFRAGCFAAALLVSGQGAVAADLSLEPLYKAPPAPAAQIYNWTGFYFGANGGGGWGHSFWSANGTGLGLSGGQAGGTVG